jgi:hypothetical protein
MFRTIQVKLRFENSLVETAVAFNKACQIVLDYSSKHMTQVKIQVKQGNISPSERSNSEPSFSVGSNCKRPNFRNAQKNKILKNSQKAPYHQIR